MAMVTPFKNWTKKSDIRWSSPRSPSLILLLGLLTYLFNFLPGVENLLAFGADNILQTLERVVGVRIGKTGVIAKRCLSVEVPDGDVTQQGLELPTA